MQTLCREGEGMAGFEEYEFSLSRAALRGDTEMRYADVWSHVFHPTARRLRVRRAGAWRRSSSSVAMPGLRLGPRRRVSAPVVTVRYLPASLPQRPCFQPGATQEVYLHRVPPSGCSIRNSRRHSRRVFMLVAQRRVRCLSSSPSKWRWFAASSELPLFQRVRSRANHRRLSVSFGTARGDQPLRLPVLPLPPAVRERHGDAPQQRTCVVCSEVNQAGI